MQRLSVVTITIILYAFSNTLLFAADNNIPGLADLAEDTNLHFDQKYCTQCHETVPEKGVDTLLRFDGNLRQLCRCHYNTRGRCPHPADIQPSQIMKTRIPADLPLKNGRICCTTCHDVYLQCRDSDIDRLFPKGDAFLRGAPFSNKTTQCFRCHDKEQYGMLNPHDQLDGSGKIIVERCLYCHVEKPDEKKAGYKDVKLVGDLEMLCVRCHGRVKANRQSLHATHIRKPSAQVLAGIVQAEKTFKTTLPLDAEGKVTCVTCHNPHEKGVIPATKPAAKGASEPFKQRTPGNMCIACHVMQQGISGSKMGRR